MVSGLLFCRIIFLLLFSAGYINDCSGPWGKFVYQPACLQVEFREAFKTRLSGLRVGRLNGNDRWKVHGTLGFITSAFEIFM